jgi:hypothetical protein
MSIITRTLSFQVRKFSKNNQKFKNALKLRYIDCSNESSKLDVYNLESLEVYNKLRNCNDSYISSQVNKALDVLSDSLRLYGIEQIFSSYNGGKDADVIMHLLRAAAAKYSLDQGKNLRFKLIYFVNVDEFKEVTDHVANSELIYGLNITRYNCNIVEVRFCFLIKIYEFYD